jgi:hypothetical protein
MFWKIRRCLIPVLSGLPPVPPSRPSCPYTHPWSLPACCNPYCQHIPFRTGTLDAIIDTVSAEHDINAGISLLAPRGHYVVVGLPPHRPTLNHQAMVMNCLSFAGSSVGNTAMTQVCRDSQYG